MSHEEAISSSRGKITTTFGEVVITSEFDSGNLDRAEECRSSLGPGTREFNVWTASDCVGLPCESSCRSWFYFSVSVPSNSAGLTLRFNIQNLNKQCRLYQQGLTPITKTVPGRGGWERLRDRVEYEINEDGVYVLSFQTTIPDSRKLTQYFAFCFPHSYTDSQRLLSKLDEEYGTVGPEGERIYYHRELVCRSLEGRRVDLLTVSSYDGMTNKREPRLDKLFPDLSVERAYTFTGKKVMFVSSRVHPGESPSSHVFNGFLHFILRRDDPRAVTLRKHFVFKLIPFLNPDGISRGHYRMDTQGINLNRVYLDPTFEQYPSIFAARSLIIHHHKKGFHSNADKTRRLPKITSSDSICASTVSDNPTSTPSPSRGLKSCSTGCITGTKHPPESRSGTSHSAPSYLQQAKSSSTSSAPPQDTLSVTKKSGIAFYVDLHAHATKRGCFFYGNYFSDIAEQTENMLFPKLVSLNSPHLDFEQCVFSEKNMYTRDKQDGSSKEGSGRVAIYKATGIIHSYTLECNYNSGRLVNSVGAATLADGRVTPPHPGSPMPHKFSIQDYEQVGHALAVAALDFYQLNPWTRLPNTDYKSLAGLRDSLLQRNCNTRTKRTKLSTRPGLSLPSKAPEVDELSPPEPLLGKTSNCSSKFKTPQTLWMSKGSASIAYEIQLEGMSKRVSRRPNLSRRGSNKWRSKQKGKNSSLKQSMQPVELSMPSAIKPSVQDLVFPFDPRMGVDTALTSKSLKIVRSKAVSRTSHGLSLTSLKTRPHVNKDLRRPKTDPLPAIQPALKHRTPVAGCSGVIKKASVIQSKVLVSCSTDESLEKRIDNGADLPLRNQSDPL